MKQIGFICYICLALSDDELRWMDEWIKFWMLNLPFNVHFNLMHVVMSAFSTHVPLETTVESASTSSKKIRAQNIFSLDVRIWKAARAFFMRKKQRNEQRHFTPAWGLPSHLFMLLLNSTNVCFNFNHLVARDDFIFRRRCRRRWKKLLLGIVWLFCGHFLRSTLIFPNRAGTKSAKANDRNVTNVPLIFTFFM